MWRHHLYLFFLPMAQPKAKILLLNFVCVLSVCISITNIPVFWTTWKFRIFFWKIEILNFGGQNRKIWKIRDSHFIGPSILRRLVFKIASYFKTEHSSSLQIFAVFWPKMAKNDVTKTPFAEKFLDGFFWNFDGRRQIHAGEGIESFASISRFSRFWITSKFRILEAFVIKKNRKF